MGAKTIEELVALLREQPPEISAAEAQARFNQQTAEIREAPRTAWTLVSLTDALGEADLSVRLKRAMSLGTLDDVTVQDFLDGSDKFNKLFNNQLGFGAKTLKELSLGVQAYVAAHQDTPITSGHEQVAERNAARDRLTIGEVISLARDAVRLLDPKQSEVITKRYGLDGSAKHTLNDIAQQVHVTRERVRQVESKALRVLGTKKTRWLFERLLTELVEIPGQLCRLGIQRSRTTRSPEAVTNLNLSSS